MKTGRTFLFFAFSLAILMATQIARADVKSAAAGSFTIELDLLLPAAPEAVYDAATGDISAWWDHTFSPKPKKLYIDTKPGGGFWEIFDDTGNGVQHATIIWAERGKRLRFVGPLGFSGTALDMVTTYDFKAEGTGTRMHLTVKASGQVDESTAKVVDQVWHHFLIERFQPYIESGDYKKPRASSGMNSQPAESQPRVRATLADFAWMSGRWSGNVGKNPIEYECSEPRGMEMLCMFRVFDEQTANVLGVECVSLLETSAGMKEHIRFLTPTLALDGPGEVTMDLEILAPDRSVFVNLNGTRPKRTTTLRHGNDAFTSHIEMLDEQGKPSAMDAQWVRAK